MEWFQTIDWSTSLGWFLVVALFAIGMLGAVFPILPGVISVFAALIVYGLFFGFERFGVTYWVIQSLLFLIIFIADYWITSIAVKKSGGSKGSITGTNLGLILGPLLIPTFGILLGPLIGSIVGEMPSSREPKHLLKVAFGSLLGFLVSVVVKIVLQSVMIVLFIVAIVS